MESAGWADVDSLWVSADIVFHAQCVGVNAKIVGSGYIVVHRFVRSILT